MVDVVTAETIVLEIIETSNGGGGLPDTAAALVDQAQIAWPLGASSVGKVTLGGNRTLLNPTGMLDGGRYVLRVTQDATGSRTLAYGDAYLWAEDTAPVLSTDSGMIDILLFESDGVNMFGRAFLGYSTGSFIPPVGFAFVVDDETGFYVVDDDTGEFVVTEI